jgi:hypothetical protein
MAFGVKAHSLIYLCPPPFPLKSSIVANIHPFAATSTYIRTAYSFVAVFNLEIGSLAFVDGFFRSSYSRTKFTGSKWKGGIPARLVRSTTASRAYGNIIAAQLIFTILDQSPSS